MNPARAWLASICLVFVAGCSLVDRTEAENETEQITSSGISFDAPSDWQQFDTGMIAEGAAGNSVVRDFADRLGVTPQQFEALIEQIDVMLFSDEGAQSGFLDNINVLAQPGPMPNTEQLELQYFALGAKSASATGVDTDLGNANLVTYRLKVGQATVQGASLFAQVDGEVVSITVSTTDKDLTDDLINRIVQTVRADS